MPSTTPDDPGIAKESAMTPLAHQPTVGPDDQPAAEPTPYGPAPATGWVQAIRERCNRWSVFGRVVATLLTGALLFVPWALSAVAGLIVYSGCFIDCGEPNRPWGLTLWLVSTILLASWSAMLPWAVERGDLSRRFAVTTFGLAWLVGLYAFAAS